MIRIVATCVTLCFIASPAFSEPFSIPNVQHGEVRDYSVKRIEQSKNLGIKSFVRPGEEVSAFTLSSEWRTPPGGGRELVVRRDDTRAGGHHCIYTFVFPVKDKIIVSKSYNQEVRAPSGNVLRSERATMWAADGNPRPDLVHIIGISEAIRGFDFKQGAKTSVRVWFPDGGPESPRLNLTVLGAESITVPAGKYRTWRVSMELDLSNILGKWKGIDFLLKVFMPTYTFWYGDGPSHPLVRFQGQFGPKTSAPVEIHDMKKIEIRSGSND